MTWNFKCQPSIRQKPLFIKEYVHSAAVKRRTENEPVWWIIILWWIFRLVILMNICHVTNTHVCHIDEYLYQSLWWIITLWQRCKACPCRGRWKMWCSDWIIQGGQSSYWLMGIWFVTSGHNHTRVYVEINTIQMASSCKCWGCSV